MSTPHLRTAAWRKSSYSGEGGNCIEIADGFPGLIPIRDSKIPDGQRLMFTADAWTSFTRALKAGELPSA